MLKCFNRVDKIQLLSYIIHPKCWGVCSLNICYFASYIYINHKDMAKQLAPAFHVALNPFWWHPWTTLCNVTSLAELRWVISKQHMKSWKLVILKYTCSLVNNTSSNCDHKILCCQWPVHAQRKNEPTNDIQLHPCGSTKATTPLPLFGRLSFMVNHSVNC